jgi:uncharacterized membrane protein YfcA
MQWIAVVIMGVLLGLLGGGGGILTVPILVSGFGFTPETATGASLFVVGTASIVGAAQGLRTGQVQIKRALALAISSMIGAFLSRAVLMPLIPARIGSLTRGDVLMIALGTIMLLVAYRMLQKTPESDSEPVSVPIVVATGFGIGIISGTLGAGGGFLLVPAMTLLMGLTLKEAVPTSLAVIALQSLAGFAGELSKPIAWNILLPITGISLLGMIIGVFLRPKIAEAPLKKAFAGLIVIVAIYLFVKVFAGL